EIHRAIDRIHQSKGKCVRIKVVIAEGTDVHGGRIRAVLRDNPLQSLSHFRCSVLPMNIVIAAVSSTLLARQQARGQSVMIGQPATFDTTESGEGGIVLVTVGGDRHTVFKIDNQKYK
ncbi:MAG: hypothetical protein ACJA2O_002700, partial [Candidatus Azotimanducaceae bacterium]